MSDGAEIRDLNPGDIEDVRRIHEATQIDYALPDLNSPLFLVKKALEVDERVRVCVGGRLQLEAYLWSDPGNWADPEQKLVAIQSVAEAAIEDAREKGIDEVVLWLPPGMDRFGKRLEIDLGFGKDRSGWQSYSKRI